VGAHIQNANTVHPEWQDVHVGDTVWLARHYGDAAKQVVAAVAPGAHLVLMSLGDFERVQQGLRASDAWGFYLRRKDGWTRLIARGSGGAVGHVTFDMPHFVMEQKMMRGIRDRAEQSVETRSMPSLDTGIRGEQQIPAVSSKIAENASPSALAVGR
jgi:hypothetical protein